MRVGTPVVHQAGLTAIGSRGKGRTADSGRLGAPTEAAIGGGRGPAAARFRSPRALTAAAAASAALSLPALRPSTMAASVWCGEKLALGVLL